MCWLVLRGSLLVIVVCRRLMFSDRFCSLYVVGCSFVVVCCLV